MLLGLQAADAGPPARRQDLDFLADLQLTVDQGAGDDGSETRHGEDAVDREPRPSGLSPVPLICKLPIQLRPERVEALPGGG